MCSPPKFSFDENKFIYKFVCDYTNDSDFDLEPSFKEYFKNFVSSNSFNYNMHVYHYLRYKFKIRKEDASITIRNYLYERLYQIIKTAIKH
jgi:hypothetical protein